MNLIRRTTEFACYGLALSLPFGFALILGAKSLNLWGGDIILPILVCLIVAGRILQKKKPVMPGWGIQIFAVALGTCLLFQNRASLVDAGQLGLYVLGTWVACTEMKGTKFERHLPIIIGIQLGAMIGLALYQVFAIKAEDYLVRAWLPNYHVYSSLVVIAFLYISPLLLRKRSTLGTMLLLAFGAGLALTIKSPAALVALAIGGIGQTAVLVTSGNQQKRIWHKVLPSIVSVVISLCAALFPQNIENMRRYISPMEPSNVASQYSRIQSILYNLPMLSIKAGPCTIGFHNPQHSTLNPSTLGKYEELNGRPLIKQCLVERLVSIRMAQSNPAIGLGLGQFQARKDQFYGSIPKVNTTEPFGYSSLAIGLGTGGVIFLIGMLAIIGGQIHSLWGSIVNAQPSILNPHPSGFTSSALIGALGSSVAFLILSYQITTFICPILVLFILLGELHSFSAAPQSNRQIIK